MLTLLFYERVDVPPTVPDDLDDALQQVGVVFESPPDAPYRSGRWRHPSTGAWCHCDLGEPPLDGEELHPPTAYIGWRPLPLTIQIPLSGPHWWCVEALDLVERLLARLPAVVPLDSEDTRRDDASDPGPYGFDRLRLLANWERQHAAQTEGTDLPRMHRHASLALWRYRRERDAGRRERPDLVWPEALVLRDGDAARSAALWADASEPLALPPVDLVVIRRPGGTRGAVPADEVLTAVGGGELLAHGVARLIPVNERMTGFFVGASLLPVERFQALADGEWSD